MESALFVILFMVGILGFFFILVPLFSKGMMPKEPKEPPKEPSPQPKRR